MRIISWNVKRANKYRDDVWGYRKVLGPDIALLQEVGSFPESVTSEFAILDRKANAWERRLMKFSTAMMVKGTIKSEIHFTTPWDWVNDELDNYTGNIIPAEVLLNLGAVNARNR